MTLKDILGNNLDELSDDQWQAVQDALTAIMQARMPQGNTTNAPPPSAHIAIDPNLKKPVSAHMSSPIDQHTIIDDPDHVLDQQKSQNSTAGNKENSNTPDSATDQGDIQDSKSTTINNSEEQANSDLNPDNIPDKASQPESDVQGHKENAETPKTNDGQNSSSKVANNEKDDELEDNKNDSADGGEQANEEDANINKLNTNSQNTTDNYAEDSKGNAEDLENSEDPTEKATTEEPTTESTDDENENDDNDKYDFDSYKFYKDTPDLNIGQEEKIKATRKRKIEQARVTDLGQQAIKKGQKINVAPTSIEAIQKAIDKLAGLSDKELEELDENVFNTYLNNVLDAIDRIIEIPYTSDRAARIKKLQNELATNTDNDLNKEDQNIIDAEKKVKEYEKQKLAARDQEKEKYRTAALKPLKAFYLDFSNAIAQQVDDLYDEEEVDTYDRFNRHHDNDGIIAKGTKLDDKNDSDFPVIDIYMDCSGSWGYSDVEIGKQAVKSILDYEERGEVKVNIYYFSEHVHSDYASARKEGGTSAWFEIIQNILANHTKNVVIITDEDMNYQGTQMSPKKVLVNGFVWYVWKHGYRAPSLPMTLQGRLGTLQYKF